MKQFCKIEIGLCARHHESWLFTYAYTQRGHYVKNNHTKDHTYGKGIQTEEIYTWRGHAHLGTYIRRAYARRNIPIVFCM